MSFRDALHSTAPAEDNPAPELREMLSKVAAAWPQPWLVKHIDRSAEREKLERLWRDGWLMRHHGQSAPGFNISIRGERWAQRQGILGLPK